MPVLDVFEREEEDVLARRRSESLHAALIVSALLLGVLVAVGDGERYGMLDHRASYERPTCTHVMVQCSVLALSQDVTGK